MSDAIFRIRQALPEDLPRLTEIEIDAYATLFASRGGSPVPHTLPHNELKQSLESGLLFVAIGADEIPVGFLAGAEIDGALYVKEIDVALGWQRKGVGRRLMISAIETAWARDLWGVTLTTDRYVPFNAPFYSSLGFREANDSDAVPGLKDILHKEMSHGGDASRRCAMVLRRRL